MALLSVGNEKEIIDHDESCRHLDAALNSLAKGISRLLIIPPDITRLHSQAGYITRHIWQKLGPSVKIDILPALGTHDPMTQTELRRMFGLEIPMEAFLIHRWREGLVRLGEIPSKRICELSEGKLDYSIEVAINEQLFKGDYDLILSLGQVAPHEVAGMANYTKNILVGTGGKDIIDKTHFLGAVYGMERIMGRVHNPVRSVIDEGFDNFLRDLPIHFILTVIEKVGDDFALRGLFCGDETAIYEAAAELSRKVNIGLLKHPVQKAVVYLPPGEFKTTWLGNKAVYRLRMAMADEGELVVMAPGVNRFGEDFELDRLIRKYGYFGRDAILNEVESNSELSRNLAVAAHLIHGSSEGRFRITYCPGPGISRADIESVGYQYGDCEKVLERYNPARLKDGWNAVDGGEKIFYVSDPSLGLWATRERFSA